MSLPFVVGLQAVTPARGEHLEQLFTGAGYQVRIEAGVEPCPAPTPAIGVVDALVIDLVSAPDVGVLEAPSLARAWRSSIPILLVAPERLAAEVPRHRPGTTTHVAVCGGRQELLLRVAVTCRHGRALRARLGRLGVHLDHEVLSAVGPAGRAAALTQVEFDLLRSVVMGNGDTVSRSHLVRACWSTRRRVPDATIDSHVRRLRAKLLAAGLPLGIAAVRGAGFALTTPSVV